MTNLAQLPTSKVLNRGVRRTAFGLALVCALTIAATHPAHAQTFTVLHVFTGGGDGSNPTGSLAIASAGVLYGTSSTGGNNDSGVVFKLAQRGSGWVLNPLYGFSAPNDGQRPYSGVVIGPSGTLYGTTVQGGSTGGGTVFELRPPLTVCKAVQCYWNETILHSFAGSPDGANPTYGNLTFDQAGNIYGTAARGGTSNDGVAFELAQSGGQWAETILHSFGSNDGLYPQAGVIFDAAGDLYGTTLHGGTGHDCQNGCGIAYQLALSNGAWAEHTVVNFDLEMSGGTPYAILTRDPSGDLYGTTSAGGASQAGTAFRLTPEPDGTWTERVIFSFGGGDGGGDPGPLTADAAGNLYGMAPYGGLYGHGVVFELMPKEGQWTETVLHAFSAGSDGAFPGGAVVLDSAGNLYGTTQGGGAYGQGVVYQITP
jgi:uncharacterized repeat protein (TIGR03803 family)